MFDYTRKILIENLCLPLVFIEAEEGTWITIHGVHVLIKDGESVGDAFKRTTGKDLGEGEKAGYQKMYDKYHGKKSGDATQTTTQTDTTQNINSGNANSGGEGKPMNIPEDKMSKTKIFAANLNANIQSRKLSGGIERVKATPEDAGRVTLTFFNRRGEEEFSLPVTTEGKYNEARMAALPYNTQFHIKKVIGEWAEP